MRRVHDEADLANFPYGLMLWPSAVGLAQALAERPSLLSGARVLEIGCGIGLAGLAADASGAARVVQTDYHEDALHLARCNAMQNGIGRVEMRRGDWRDFPADLCGVSDWVIGSDVLYDREMHDTLERLLPRLVAPGGTILLSDPLRPQALSFVERLEDSGFWRTEVDAQKIVFDGQKREIALFTLRLA